MRRNRSRLAHPFPFGLTVDGTETVSANGYGYETLLFALAIKLDDGEVDFGGTRIGVSGQDFLDGLEVDVLVGLNRYPAIVGRVFWHFA